MLNTLDPPGTIAVLGAGPLGIEAALYARYLGYDVVIFESAGIAQTVRQTPTAAPPDPCVSPLGIAALAAQRTVGGTHVELEPTTCEQWVTEYLEALADTDLLRDRIRLNTEVVRVEFASESDVPYDAETDVSAEDEHDETSEEDSDPVPPDFIIYSRVGQSDVTRYRCECIIDARGTGAQPLGPPAPAGSQVDYYLRIGELAAANTNYVMGLDQIRRLFAELQDRPGLDVYGNLGGSL